MVHQYQLNGYNIVLDSCSGSVHVVDDVAYDVIAMYKEHSADEIVAAMLAKYADRPDVTEADLRQCLEDVASLEAAGKLWAPDVYKDMAFDFKNRQTVVNAVLNQKYRSMQEKHIAVILKVGDLKEICLEEEEIVILLSNLLDNAIRESEKVLKNTGKAVIHLKLECEEHKLIFAVRNPVTEKVEIENDTIKSKRGDHHGIGLLNVKVVVDKYGGDMVLSCDENEFKAVVIL